MVANLEAPILIVNDDAAMLRAMECHLLELGFMNVTTTSNGGTALGSLKEHAFALIIAEWNILPMSGLQLLKNIRADQMLSDLKFIMVIGDADDEKIEAAYGAGANAWLLKPFGTGALGHVIDLAVEGKPKITVDLFVSDVVDMTI